MMWGTWLVGAVVVLLLTLAARKLYTDHKNGKGCGGSCGDCTGCPGVRRYSDVH